LTWARPGLALVALLVPALSACGGDGSPKSGGHESVDPDAPSTEAVDQTVCRADATAAPDATGSGFPTEWSFPPRTTVYHREDREGTGVILTAVSEAPFDAILHFLNTDEVAAGFAITDGETEENDAEANWTSDGYTGRWTIRKSATCPGETVVQVFAAPR
jgi:hypothetical protein